MNQKKRIAIIAAMLLLLLIGAAVMLYPLVSAMYSEAVRSEVHTQYQEVINSADTSEIDAALGAAQAWNEGLFSVRFDPLRPEENGYFDLLDLTGNGIMGYIRIPKIGIVLPIYHGTEQDILAKGAGHMPQTSLPVGGENTHTVITAHSGMASSPMFSDLPLLQIGDSFSLEILGEVLTYEVYSIPEPVLPQNIDGIQLQRGEDLCTLITCTPYGVNSHRLLVHARRIPTPKVSETVPAETTEPDPDESTGSVWMEQYWRSIKAGLMAAAGLVLLILLILLIRYILRRKKRGAAHEA